MKTDMDEASLALRKSIVETVAKLEGRLMPSPKIREIHSFGLDPDDAAVLFVWLVLDDGELCHFAFSPGQRVFVQTHGPISAFESDADGHDE